MLATLLAAIRADVDRQIGWAKHEVARQTRHGVLIGALAGVAALAALGAIVVGLIALYTWLAPRHGPFAAYGMVGGGLLLTALVLFALTLLWRRPRIASRPALRIARPTAFLGMPGQRGYLKAVAVGGGTNGIHHRSRSTMLGLLALAAVAGLVVGRRL
jgi:hypothetical protein